MRQGTIVDATLIAAPSSTKTNEGKRDLEMHQIKTGNQWSFGMKVHAGVDKNSGLIHSVVVTSAHVHDLTPAADLLHTVMSRLSTATLATRASAEGSRAKEQKQNSEWRCGPANAALCQIHQKGSCKI